MGKHEVTYLWHSLETLPGEAEDSDLGIGELRAARLGGAGGGLLGRHSAISDLIL